MKGLKLKTLILTVLLVSAFAFSQDLQPKPIQYDNTEGVFVSIDLMDVISVKLLDRAILKKEVKTFKEIIASLETHVIEVDLKSNLQGSQAEKYKDLWQLSERQNTNLTNSLDNQIQITKNVKKKRLETGFYISEEVSRSVSLLSPC